MLSRKLVLLLVSVSLGTGCVSVRVNDYRQRPIVKADAAVADAYVSASGIEKYDGSLIEVDLLSQRGKWGNLASVDVWPLAGLGIGMFGIQGKLLPVEFGMGAFDYRYKGDKTGKRAKPVCRPEKEHKGRVHIQARVDGKDEFKIQGDKLWIEHHSYKLPGFQSDEGSIKIDGEEWEPTWEKNKSSVYKGIRPPVPTKASGWSIETPSGRGTVELGVERDPCGDILKVVVDDSSQGGAGDYDFVVSWE